MKKILISLAAMMIWSSCVIEDAKDEDPEPNQNPAEENKNNDHDNNDGKIVIEPYAPVTNFASEAERKAAELVDNSIKEAIDIMREYQYPKTYTLTVPKYYKAPAREELNDLGKSVYDSLYHCALRLEEFFYDGSELDKDKNFNDKFFISEFLGAYDALRKDYPELTQYFDMALKSTRSVIYTDWIEPGEHGLTNTDKESIKAYQEVFDAAVARIIKAMPKNLCDFDKYRYIATFIDVHNTYDKTLKTQGAYWPCYNVIINKTSVCSGYAETFLYLCRQAGLWCEMWDGTISGGPHAWNRIMINGKTYLCDCTFADNYAIGAGNWMDRFVQGEAERSFIGEYLHMDGKTFVTTGQDASLLWR